MTPIELYLIFVILSFFTSFFYNSKDKFFKWFFKSILHTFCIAVFALYLYFTINNIKYDMQDKFGYVSIIPKIVEYIANISLYGIPIIYNFVIIIAIKRERKN